MVDLESIQWSIQKKSIPDPEKIHDQSRKNFMVDKEKTAWSIQKIIHGLSRQNVTVDPEKFH